MREVYKKLGFYPSNNFSSTHGVLENISNATGVSEKRPRKHEPRLSRKGLREHGPRLPKKRQRKRAVRFVKYIISIIYK